MFRLNRTIQLLAILGMFAAASVVHAGHGHGHGHGKGNWSIGVNFGVPYPRHCHGPCYGPSWGYYYRPYYRPVYVAPAPVIVQQAPIVQTVPTYQPAPVYQAPAPTPAPNYQAPAPTPAPAQQQPAPATLPREIQTGATTPPGLDVNFHLANLRSSDERRRIDSVMTLGRSRVSTAVDPLAATLAGDQSPAVREAAARALGLIGSRQALPVLQRAAQADADRDVRRSAQFAAEVIQTRN